MAGNCTQVQPVAACQGRQQEILGNRADSGASGADAAGHPERRDLMAPRVVQNRHLG